MSDHESREFRQVRDKWIIDTYKAAPDDEKLAAIERCAKTQKLTTQRVRDILVGAKVLVRKSHDNQRKIKAEILKRLIAAQPSDRPALVAELSANYNFSESSIRNWCQQEGIRLHRKADSIAKAFKVAGYYMQLRNANRAAERAGVSREYAGKVAEMAEAAGLIGLAKGTMRNDPAIRKQLDIIDKANAEINKRVIELGGKGVSDGMFKRKAAKRED